MEDMLFQLVLLWKLEKSTGMLKGKLSRRFSCFVIQKVRFLELDFVVNTFKIRGNMIGMLRTQAEPFQLASSMCDVKMTGRLGHTYLRKNSLGVKLEGEILSITSFGLNKNPK